MERLEIHLSLKKKKKKKERGKITQERNRLRFFIPTRGEIRLFVRKYISWTFSIIYIVSAPITHEVKYNYNNINIIIIVRH